MEICHKNKKGKKETQLDNLWAEHMIKITCY